MNGPLTTTLCPGCIPFSSHHKVLGYQFLTTHDVVNVWCSVMLSILILVDLDKHNLHKLGSLVVLAQ